MTVLPPKYILNMTIIFRLHFAMLVLITLSSAADFELVLRFLTCPRVYYTYENERDALDFLSDCVTPRHHILQLLDIHLGSTYRILAAAWHVLSNPAPVLCDLNSCSSLLVSSIAASLVPLSILNTRQPTPASGTLLQLVSPPVLLFL